MPQTAEDVVAQWGWHAVVPSVPITDLSVLVEEELGSSPLDKQWECMCQCNQVLHPLPPLGAPRHRCVCESTSVHGSHLTTWGGVTQRLGKSKMDRGNVVGRCA